MQLRCAWKTPSSTFFAHSPQYPLNCFPFGLKMADNKIGCLPSRQAFDTVLVSRSQFVLAPGYPMSLDWPVNFPTKTAQLPVISVESIRIPETSTPLCCRFFCNRLPNESSPVALFRYTPTTIRSSSFVSGRFRCSER
jgi:hypothetical protein